MLLERDDSLKELNQAVKSIARDGGRIVLLLGEAGIGKTSLLSEFRKQLSSDIRLLWGGCDPFQTPRPLGPVYDMAMGMESLADEIFKPDRDTAQLFAAIYNALNRSSKQNVLVLEDAHWADDATLDLLRYLGRRISFLKTLLVISCRDDEIDRDHPLRQVIGELPQSLITRIRLSPLSPKAVSKLAQSTGRADTNIFQITNGNPFFVTELLAEHLEEGEHIPASIRDAVDARLNRLPDAEREFLETISLLPGGISPDLIETFFGSDGKQLAQACVKRNFLKLDAQGDYRFRHELARLSTMDRVSKARCKELHEKFLGYGEKHHPENLEALVHHATGAQDGQAVLNYAPKAARRAARLGSHRQAASHLASALEYVDLADQQQRAQLHQDWSYEAAMSLQIDEDVIKARHTAMDIWKTIDRPEKVGENLRALSRLHWYRGESGQATQYSDEAIEVFEALPPSADRAMAYSMRSQIHMLHDRMNEAIVWGRKAIELAEEFDDVQVKVHALNNVGTAKVFRGDLDGRELLEESLELALEHNLHEDAARVYTNLSEFAVEFRKFDLANKILPDGIKFSNKHDIRSFSPYLTGRLAQLKMAQGQFGEAESIANGVMDSGQKTLLMRLPALIVLSKCRMRLGRPGAEDALKQAYQDAVSTEELQYINPARLSLIEFAWLTDQPDRATAHIDALSQLDPAKMHPWNRGDFTVWADRLNVSLPQGFVTDLPRPYMLELKKDFTGAAKSWNEIGDPYARAICLLRGSEVNGPKYLKDAVKLFAELDAEGAIDKARRVSEQIGLNSAFPKSRRGPYSASRKHPLGLTKREQEILRLISTGANNKEISQSLSRSQRTVEHHVSNILKKLDVDNRMDAMLRVHNEPWITTDK